MSRTRKRRVTPIELRQVGVRWPHPDVRPERLVWTHDGRIDLKASIIKLTSEAEAISWRCTHPADRAYVRELRRTVEALQQMRGALREQLGQVLPEFYEALDDYLMGLFTGAIIREVLAIARLNDLAARTPEERRDCLDVLAKHHERYARGGPRRQRRARLAEAFRSAMAFCCARGPG
jgi:hypothetical protein